MKTTAAIAAATATLMLAACSSAPPTATNETVTVTATPQAATATNTPAAQPLARGAEAKLDTIPWSQVGAGWTLATWSPVAGGHPGDEPAPGEPTRDKSTTTLYLVNPGGGRYAITTFPPPGDKAAPELVDWSGDGSTALFSDQYAKPPSAILVDLHTGKQTTIPVNDSYPHFTRPNGKAILLAQQDNYQAPYTLQRVDLTGKTQFTYPTDNLGGTFGGSVVSAPDGTQLVLGTSTGLVMMGNDGAVGRQLPVAGQTDCAAVRWWDGTTVLAHCAVGDSFTKRLWLVPIDGGTPTALTAANDGQKGDDLGDANAWKLPSGTFIQALGACGVIYLAKLNADGTTTKVEVPNATESIRVLGTHGDDLTLQAHAACGPGQNLLDYNPTTNTSTVLLGPTVNGGGVIDAVAFPGQE